MIEQTLDAEVITLGMGVCAGFRDQNEAELFEASRNRRRIDWTEISSQLRFSIAPSRRRSQVDRYELHKELFDQLGRRGLRSTPTSLAAHAVLPPIPTSSAAVDSAVDQSFYSAVFEPVYREVGPLSPPPGARLSDYDGFDTRKKGGNVGTPPVSL